MARQNSVTNSNGGLAAPEVQRQRLLEVSMKRGPQNRPHDTMILVIWTPKKGPPFWKQPLKLLPGLLTTISAVMSEAEVRQR